jgi:neutral ceramidase
MQLYILLGIAAIACGSSTDCRTGSESGTPKFASQGRPIVPGRDEMTRTGMMIRAWLFALGIGGAMTQAQDFRAGAGKSDIQTSSAMWPVDGFTSQHDPLAVRVLVMDDGKTRSAIVVIDQTSISEGVLDSAKGAVTRIAGVQPENTIVVASHTFSAPHVMGLGGPGGGNAGPGGAGPGGPGPAPSAGTLAFARAIGAAVENAVTQAKASMQPATVGFGLGTSDVAVNRDVPTPKGWWLGGDPSGYSDKTLPVVRIDGKDGKPLAVLINEAVQSSIMDHSENANGSKPVTADITGAATRFVEEQYGGGTVALFLIGAAGDQAPIFQGNRYVLGRDGTVSRWWTSSASAWAARRSRSPKASRRQKLPRCRYGADR